LSAPTEPFELVAVEAAGEPALPAPLRSRLLVHTVHDGGVIPERFGSRVDPAALAETHIRERDWGANLVAESIARAAGLRGYGRVNIARAVLDFNRFPGSTPPGNHHPLERLAINPPFSDALRHPEKMDLLDIYDAISDRYERLLPEQLMLIGVHTYDEHNPSATSRPHLSIVNQPLGYHRHARMSHGVFDPIYPDVLGESTSSRILRDRMSLNLERSGYRVSSNHPYALPEGSIEVRSQVWFFFSFVKQHFTSAHPETDGDPAFDLVWRMLLNTNMRVAEPEALRGYLHRFRTPAPEQAELFGRALAAYEQVCGFVDEGLVREYRRSPDRPSSLALEVRKDLLCELDESGRPRPATESMRARAAEIGEIVAGAIKTFFEVDR
jgi:hypothetical protein